MIKFDQMKGTEAQAKETNRPTTRITCPSCGVGQVRREKLSCSNPKCIKYREPYRSMEEALRERKNREEDKIGA